MGGRDNGTGGTEAGLGMRKQGHTGWAVAIMAGALAVAGCSDARKTLGFDRSPPDEFKVVAQAPLSLPPEFSLKPPRPGAQRPQDATTRQQAASYVFGASRPAAGTDRLFGAAGGLGGGTGSGSSGGESALLDRAGATQALPNIRAVIDQETASLITGDRRWVDALIFWQKPTEPYSVIDPAAEAQRLRAAVEQGKPLTEGDTPVIVRKRRAPLEGLF